jgi:hypothetical protein
MLLPSHLIGVGQSIATVIIFLKNYCMNNFGQFNIKPEAKSFEGDKIKIDRIMNKQMDCYNGAGCSLVPLVNNNFNHHKSNLKILEAACKKIPAIVSYVPPYSDDIDAPVLWVKHKSDWYKHIKALHESEAMRFDYGQRLHEWAQTKYNFRYWNNVRFELYKKLLD